jgi:perosamine synthetase
MEMEKTWRMGEKEIAYLKEAIDGHLTGKMNIQLEERFAEKFGVKYAIGCNSGTSTLHCCLAAMGVGYGDEVIVPPLTYASTAFSVMYLGAIPVFADVDSETFNIDPNEIEDKITPRTKAVIPVALYGLPPDMHSIMKITKSHGIYALEDSAECFFGSQNGNISGTIGDMGSFSFERSKHITCGDGGIIITDNKELAENARQFSILGFSTLRAKRRDSSVSKDVIQDPDFSRHLMVSPNYSLPELCAAVALAQLERLDEFVQKRIQIAEMYEEAIQGCDWLVPQKTPGGYVNSYWTYALKLDNTAISWHKFRKTFLNEGGERFYAACKVNYLEPALRGLKFSANRIEYNKGLCPIAEDLQSRLILLKTNFMDIGYAKKQASVLERTIKKLGVLEDSLKN